MRISLAILLVGSGSACFSPEIADGTIACGEAGCPEGMVCATDGYCYSTPPGADVDARVVLAIANNDGNNRLYAYCRDELTPVWTDDTARMNHAVAWGDADGDGVPELAVASGDDGVRTYAVRDGGLDEVGYLDLLSARDVAWAQWDDGPRDVAVANPDGFWMLRPLEDGGLEIEWQSGAHDGLAVAAADFDGDGWDDLAGGTRGESVGVYRSDGSDALSAMWWDDGGPAEAVAWGDIDDDDAPDVVSGASRIEVYRNDGDYFEEVWSADLEVNAVALANIDGDGDDDLAVASLDGPVLVFENTDGTLDEIWRSDDGGVVSSVAWGDLDGDGDADLAAGARVYRNDGGGRMSLAWSGDDVATDVAWGRWSGGPDPCSW